MKKITRVNFPATVVNARIAESINVFYDSMEDFYQKNNWHWTKEKRTGNKWIQEDFNVEIKNTYPDGAYKQIIFTMRRLPGIVGNSTGSSLKTNNKHQFSIILPREYPANLARIKMQSLTPLWHPRISMGRSGDACITVNGEVDRILIDLIYHILMDPKRIRPPKLYPKEDSGMNVQAMRWFEKDADNIHKLLIVKWDSLHKKSSHKETGSGIKIIGSKKEELKAKKADKAIRIISDEDDKEKKKKGGVRIV